MNKILKKILEVAEEIGEEAVPGSKWVISGAKMLLDKDNTNNSVAIIQLSSGTIQVLEDLKPELIKDTSLLAEGLVEIKAGYAKIQKAIK